MLNLANKLKKDAEDKANGGGTGGGGKNGKKFLIRDSLLVKEVQELQDGLPATCEINFDDPDKLWDFTVVISPTEGPWEKGSFKFHVLVTEEYNFAPPIVKCQTNIWHPNINEGGAVCLSLLRQAAIDGMGWAPTRRLTDVVCGLNCLFTDLLNFDDPLNLDAAKQWEEDKNAFQSKVNDYIRRYSEKNSGSGRR